MSCCLIISWMGTQESYALLGPALRAALTHISKSCTSDSCVSTHQTHRNMDVKVKYGQALVTGRMMRRLQESLTALPMSMGRM